MERYQSSSNEKLPPLVPADRSPTPEPKRKMAVVHRTNLNQDERIPPINISGGRNEGRHDSAKRSLSIPICPMTSHRNKASSNASISNIDSRSRHRNASLQPISPRNRLNDQTSPQRRRKFLSTVVPYSPVSYIGEGRTNHKSISLEDVNLEDKVAGYHDVKGDFFETDGGSWSNHWHYTRKSIGARPDDIGTTDPEVLSQMFNKNVRIIKSMDYAGDIAMYGTQEPDDTLENSMTLEERLASIEKQQGLPHT